VPIVTVPNVNETEAVAFVNRLKPDIVCVNGTNLLRQPMLDLAANIPFGIINLHTGLSPYSRGGNCNLFALLEGHPEWVGVTVHYIDPGIDSGDLIRTAQVPMDPDDTYDHIDARTFHLGIDLLVQAVSDVATRSAARVPQWEAGKLFLRRTGYIYEPWHWYQVNRCLKSGLVKRYLDNRLELNQGVRLIGGGR
jgi:methionyl-tRNA formyltransferase